MYKFVLIMFGLIALFTLSVEGQELEQSDNSTGEKEVGLAMDLAGPTYSLVKDNSGRQRYNVFSAISSNFAIQSWPWREEYLFKMSREQMDAIRAIQWSDAVTFWKLSDVFSKEIEKLYRQGYKDGDPEIEEAFAAQELVRRQFFDAGESQNERIAEVLDAEQLEALRRGMKGLAVREFGGIGRLYRKALSQQGLTPSKRLTKEQSERIEKLSREYQKKRLELNIEFGERLLELLPKEERDAVADAMGIKGLEKKKGQ